MTKAIFGSFSVQSNGMPLLFDRPLRIYSTSQLSKVVPLLGEIEAASKSGYWVALMLSYEAAPAFDKALKTHTPDTLPLAWAAVFDGPSETGSTFCGDGYSVSDWEPQISRSEYSEAISRIHQLITRGDTYQVNYTFPLTSIFTGDPLSWYRNLGIAQASDHCAYLDLGRYRILSLSPELFFERRSDVIRTKPMKGTIGRGRWNTEDEMMANQLVKSEKDRAENVMIVDLLRNDLGKVSIPGSVRVSKLFEVERFETLWQMTSTVESTLYRDIGLADLMKAVFPCGSITGAPKIRTMEIIGDLESYSRGVYTGTIGLIRPGGDCVFNVAIRTVVIDSQTGIATFGVGSGITIDSKAKEEYEECLLKTSFLNSSAAPFRLLETILLEHGKFFLLGRHMERLKTSAYYFGFRFSATEVLDELNRTATTRSSGSWRVRLLLARGGEVEIESTQIRGKEQKELRVCLAPKPVDSSNRFLFHKTTKREIYDEARAARPDHDDVILWNERGEVTESTVANVVVSIDGELYTPPLQSGLLGGTFRAELLAEGRIRERFIRVEELQEIPQFFLINSVRKWMPARLFA